jgi:hypothetical protein
MRINEFITEDANLKRQAAIAIAMKNAGKKPHNEGYAMEDEQVDGMAQGEIREIIRNAIKIKEKLDSGVSLDGWMYSYVTTSNDRLNSVAEQIGNPNIDEQGMGEDLTEFAPNKPPTGGGGRPKDYGKPTSSRYIGGNKFVVGTTNNYVLTATIDKWGLEWDEDDNKWFLDSPGAAHIADASEGEIELPPPQEQRYQIHDLVTDYLNERNSPDLQKVAKYYGHTDDGEMATNEGENWSKYNHKRVGGMSKKSVASYRRSHPGSKIQTAVTTKPSKLKKGSKSAKRRASFCARMRGMKKHRTGAKTARDPNSNINKSLRRWHCESIEQMQELVMLAEQKIRKLRK